MECVSVTAHYAARRFAFGLRSLLESSPVSCAALLRVSCPPYLLSYVPRTTK